MRQHHQQLIDRLVSACQADERIIATFLGGSFAKGTADAYSDIDLCVITTDEAYEAFIAQRESFIRLLGEPLLLEDFDHSDMSFFILADGIEGELGIGSKSHFNTLHKGAYVVLLDKTGILEGAVFTGQAIDEAQQLETLRRLIHWFWHDLSHFITAMGRGQLWWAQGQLEILRRMCIDLARMSHNFSEGAEGYDKLDQTLPVAQLEALQSTFCPLEYAAMLQAGLVIVDFYQELAVSLAAKYGIPYRHDLQRLMSARLEKLPTQYLR